MPTDRWSPWCTALVAMLALGGSAWGGPTEPQAAFALKDGWVELALRQEGRPIANATIQIMDEKGGKFGDGETGDDGQTAFPMPAGASFVIEIKSGERTADPIRLFKVGSTVEPARVLLSYGLRPCCRSIKTPEETPAPSAPAVTASKSSDPPPSAPWRIVVFAGVAVALALASVAWRRFASAMKSTPGTQP